MNSIMTNNESDVELYQEEKLTTFSKLVRIMKIIFFYTVLVAIIVLDMCVFQRFNNWGSPVAILVLELILLVLLAQHTHIDYIEVLADKILNFTQNK